MVILNEIQYLFNLFIFVVEVKRFLTLYLSGLTHQISMDMSKVDQCTQCSSLCPTVGAPGIKQKQEVFEIP